MRLNFIDPKFRNSAPHWTHYLFFFLSSICKDKACMFEINGTSWLSVCTRGLLVPHTGAVTMPESSSHCQGGGAPCGTDTVEKCFLTALFFYCICFMESETRELTIVNHLRHRLPDLWPRTIKLNSPLGFFDCLCSPPPRLFPLASLSCSAWKIRSICFLCLMSWTSVGAVPLLTAAICTLEGIEHWSRFPNIERPDGKYFIRRRVDKWLASIASALAVERVADAQTMRVGILTDCLWASDGRWIGSAAHHPLGTSEPLLIITSPVIDSRPPSAAKCFFCFLKGTQLLFAFVQLNFF